MKPFERGVDVITRGLDSSTPVIPVYLDGLWGHALSLKGGRPFSSRLKLRHEVTVYVGEPIFSDSKQGDVSSEHLHQRVLELGTQAAECRKSAASTLSHRFVEAAKTQLVVRSRLPIPPANNSASAKP